MAGKCGALIMLAVLTAEDLKEKKISIKKTGLFGVLALVYAVGMENAAWQELAYRILPGALLLFVAGISKESIGYGDGAVVGILGLLTGASFTWAILCIGILAAGGFGMICVLRKRLEPFPFLPFLLLGMEVILGVT